MTEEYALFRARLGAALRSLPSELSWRRRERICMERYASPEVLVLATQLERCTPGLALMMQLRARLFEQVACAAHERGFDQVVTVGWGFARCRIRQAEGGRPRFVAIEHPAVLGTNAGIVDASPRDNIHAPAIDFERGAWAALTEHACCRRDRKTLLLVQGLSLWGSPDALAYWLRKIVEGTAPGSEMLLNLLDESGADRARHATNGVVAFGAANRPLIRFGVDGSRLTAEINARGLELLHLFDSRQIQSMYFGVEDLLVRELYAWVRVPEGATGATAVPALRDLVLPPEALRFRELPSSFRPRLRPGVQLRDDGAAAVTFTLPVTMLRGCPISLSRRELAAISLFDGASSIADIATALTQRGLAYCSRAVSTLANTLRAHGFLAHDPIVGPDLTVLQEQAFVALRQRDASLARRVSRLLAASSINPAVVHLRAALRIARSIVFDHEGEVAVIAGSMTSRSEARAILATARKTLWAISRVLGVRLGGQVLIDVSSSRAAVPVTMIADAEPYTLVWIPLPTYSRSMLCHELTHVLAMSGSVWLSEGLAVWMQRLIAPGPCFPDDAAAESPGSYGRSLEEQLFGVSQPNVPRWNAWLERAAYREAAAFVDWMVRRSGFAGFAGLFVACRSHDAVADVEAACRSIGIRSLGDLDAEWRRCQ